ncbi:hypothetical protein AUR64_15510 [Haloprofundus marisrubri]|uniref:TM helix repeat-containing protein n=1 Tax=Haloprofundus marisrubri TaxID=1514971 RepID=A0A0W1R7D5_9EURY|nr:hypothetical protein [Haloprofundus marisrubri]KTG09199.1 hypothetical protein AUR64_15510 [Haloprofundus marisrubri]
MSQPDYHASTDTEQSTNLAVAPAAPMFVALQLGVPEFLQETVASIIAFVPRLLGALAILLVGWVIGRVVGRVVREVVDRAEIDRMALRTPVGRALGGTEQAVSATLGKLAAYYVYLLAVLAAANALAITLLSEWVAAAVSYLPAFLAGLLVIVLGFIIADFIARVVQQSSTASETRYSGVFADGVRLFLYFSVLVIGLDTMGFSVRVLYIVAQAVAYGLGAAIAIGAGLALGFGARGWVADNIDNWAGRASSGSPNFSDGAVSSDDD